MPVNIPQSGDPSGLKTILPKAGSAIGSFYGGPAGGMAGSKIGAGLVAGGPDPTAVGGDQGAVARRIDTLEDQPSVQLAKADAALKQLPLEQQQQYGPAITAARQLDAQGGP